MKKIFRYILLADNHGKFKKESLTSWADRHSLDRETVRKRWMRCFGGHVTQITGTQARIYLFHSPADNRQLPKYIECNMCRKKMSKSEYMSTTRPKGITTNNYRFGVIRTLWEVHILNAEGNPISVGQDLISLCVDCHVKLSEVFLNGHREEPVNTTHHSLQEAESYPVESIFE
jgi:hypothetical protein